MALVDDDRRFPPFTMNLLQASNDGVRLSSNLSNTIGCPASGRVVFVYPVQNQCLGGLINGNGKPHDSKVDSFIFHNCWELYLEPVPFKKSENLNNDITSSSHSTEIMHERSSKGEISSPRTPLCQPKLSSNSPCPSASPRQEAISYLSCPRNSSFDLFDMREVLKDESVKQLLQACVTSWLYSRVLLCGNIVAIPILSKLCLFRVIKAIKLMDDSKNEDFIRDKNLIVYPHAPKAVEHVKNGFAVNHDTKVCINMPMNSASETPSKTNFPLRQVGNVSGKSSMLQDISKVGGLDEEYAKMKDIIMLSVNKTLSRYVLIFFGFIFQFL